MQKLANAVIDDVRRRVQQQTTGHRGRKRDPLYGIRRLLLTGSERLDERGWRRLRVGLAAGDPDGEVAAAWQLKEITRGLYRAEGIEAARGVLDLLYAWASSGDVAEMRRFAGYVKHCNIFRNIGGGISCNTRERLPDHAPTRADEHMRRRVTIELCRTDSSHAHTSISLR